MKKYTFTIGLFDKDTEKLETTREDARELLAYILIDEFELFAFTMFDCSGVYRMESTGRESGTSANWQALTRRGSFSLIAKNKE